MRNIRQLLRTYKSLVISVAIFLFVGICAPLVIYPAAMQAFKYFTDAKTEEELVESYRKKLNLLESLDEETLKQQLIALTSALPTDKSAPSLLGTIEGVATKNNLSVSQITLSPIGTLASSSAGIKSADEKKLGSSLFSAEGQFEGTFESWSQFLHDSTQVSRLIKIKSFDLSFVDETHIESQAEIQGFFAPLPKGGSVDSPLSSLTPQEDTTLQWVLSVTPVSISSETSADSVVFEARPNPFSP